jgi:Tol biopolymer transport system component
VPSWSRDGRWIYVSSDRAGGRDIWRVPVKGGPEEPVTRTGADGGAFESDDGNILFYRRGSSLLALPLRGGQERKVVDCVSSFTVGPAGVYHLGCSTGGDTETPLFLLDPVTGRDRLLGKLEKPYFGLSVSPDGSTILYTKVVSEGSDLMMIENFR